MFKFGISIETPPGGYIHCEIRSRSGLACKKGIEVVGSGIIDNDFTSSISAFLHNSSNFNYTVYRGHRIAQLILRPYFGARLLPATAFEKVAEAEAAKKRAGIGGEEAALMKRRCGGFGSTGQ